MCTTKALSLQQCKTNTNKKSYHVGYFPGEKPTEPTRQTCRLDYFWSLCHLSLSLTPTVCSVYYTLTMGAKTSECVCSLFVYWRNLNRCECETVIWTLCCITIEIWSQHTLKCRLMFLSPTKWQRCLFVSQIVQKRSGRWWVWQRKRPNPPCLW